MSQSSVETVRTETRQREARAIYKLGENTQVEIIRMGEITQRLEVKGPKKRGRHYYELKQEVLRQHRHKTRLM